MFFLVAYKGNFPDTQYLDVPGRKLGSMVNGSMGYNNLLINGVDWGYHPFAKHLLTSWDIQVVGPPFVYQRSTRELAGNQGCRFVPYLEDRTCKSLATMVSQSPNWGGRLTSH